MRETTYAYGGVGGTRAKKRGGGNKNLRRNWKLGIFRRYCVTLNRHLLLSFFKALDVFFKFGFENTILENSIFSTSLYYAIC